jgi:hypothetical protein
MSCGAVRGVRARLDLDTYLAHHRRVIALARRERWRHRARAIGTQSFGVVVTKHPSAFGNEAEPPVELVGAGIAGQRIDHDGGHRRLGEAHL